MRLSLRLLIIIVVIGLLSTLLHALSFSTNPTISPSNATTQSSLTCSWVPSNDTIQQNVTWYNGSNPYTTESLISFSQNSSTLSSNIARKGETWTCSVILANATTTLTTNTTIVIANAAPAEPNATNQTLYEDQTKVIPLSSTDPDADTVFYSLINNDYSPFFCSIGSTSGNVTCTPSSTHNGTTNVSFIANDGSLLSGIIVGYNVIQVNDPPTFNITDQVAIEDILFNATITVTDEELDFPINFSVQSNLSSIFIQATSSTEAFISFNRVSNAPIFSEAGTWWVAVNATDAGPTSNTPYDNPTTIVNFTLTINSTNQLPNITTNLSNISGTQGFSFYFEVNATDLDTADNITFNIVPTCSISNPWIINTTNNSNNASAEVNTTLANDHIICREINLSAYDGQEYAWELITLNLTNINDAPQLYEISNAVGNTDTNMSNLSAVKGVRFVYQLNVTDIDAATYESEVLTYTDNSSIITISSSGLINFTPGDADLGTHLILINISDDENLSSSRIMNLSISNSSIPRLTNIVNFSCAEDSLCSRILLAVDDDINDTLTFSDNSSLFNLSSFNASAALLNFTPLNSQVRSHPINISVVDQFGLSSWEVFILTINNTNDAPFFDQDQNGIADNVSFGTVIEGLAKTIRVNVTDEDLSIGLDNLSYAFSFLLDPYNLSESVSISESGSDYFVISFTPNTTQAANYSINLSVSDSFNATYWQNISFTVQQKTNNPIITQIRPYNTTNGTVYAFTNASLFPNNRTGANITENTIVLFDALATNDSSINDNNLTYLWYFNNTLNTTLYNVIPGMNSSLSYNFSYFTSGTQEILLVVQDERFARSNWTWVMDISDVNRDPQYIGELDNLSVNGTLQIQDYFSYRNSQQRFYDPDDDLNSDGQRGQIFSEGTALTYSLLNSNCSFASFSFSGDDLTVTPSEIGTCFVQFQATDPYGRVANSSNVRISISDVTTQETPTSSSGGGGGSSTPRVVPIPIEEPEEVPLPLELVVPEEVNTFGNQTIQIPISLVNTWNDTLLGISVNASSNSSDNLTFRFSDDDFESIPVNENVSTILSIENYRQNKPYKIKITGIVQTPEFTDVATVFISSLEQTSSGDDVESKINFARDLLNENPECQELNELLDEAREAQLNNQYEEVIKIVSNVINGCKYLINQQKEVTPEQPKQFFSFFEIAQRNLPQIIVGAIIVVIFITLSIVLLITGRKSRKNNI